MPAARRARSTSRGRKASSSPATRRRSPSRGRAISADRAKKSSRTAVKKNASSSSSSGPQGALVILFLPVTLVLSVIESFLFALVKGYDKFVYTPVQVLSSPFVRITPRVVGGVHWFTANTVTYSRTILFIPVSYFLKYNYNVYAVYAILLHDYLDHLDGIVAKVQKTMGYQDDPNLGAFMDAFCDKVVNVFTYNAILLLTDYSHMSTRDVVLYVGLISTIIIYEAVIGTVRVQDFFHMQYSRPSKSTGSDSRNLRANMEGKLKEKLESMSLAFLCYAHQFPRPLSHWSGVAGLVCIALTLRLAHASLMHKLESRRQR